MSKFCASLKKFLKEYTERTSIHGLHYLTEQRSILEKILWAVILAFAIFGCFWMISGIWTKFESSPVVVSFSKKYTPVYDTSFPSVTVCPEAKCNSWLLNYTDVRSRYIKNKTISKNEWRDFLYMSQLCDDQDQTLLNQGEETVDEDFFQVIDKLGPFALFFCTYFDIKFENCTKILTPIITEVGICHSFNVLDRTEIYRDHVVQYKNFHSVDNYDPTLFDDDFSYTKEAGVHVYPRRALYSGAINNLNIFLKQDPKNIDYICNKFFEGFRISIHNPVDIPRMSKNYFRIPIDRTVMVAVQPELIVTSESLKGLAPEKRECYWRNEKYLRHFKIYTQANCILECKTNYTLNMCKCVDFYMPRDRDTPICGTKKSVCVRKADKQFHTDDLKAKISGNSEKNSYCDCKASCTELYYRVEMSHSQLSWRQYRRAMFKDVTNDSFQNFHISQVSVYVKDQQFMSIERNELYGSSDLIANFGGLLGLFTGFSLISFFEIIYCLTVRIFYNKKLYGSWAGIG